MEMRYSSNFVLQTAIKELRSYDVDMEALFNKEGLKLPTDSDNVDRVSVITVTRFIQVVLKATGDPCFGLNFSKFIHPTTFSNLGIALLSSSTLRDFCERLALYYEFIATNYAITFEESGELAWLEIKPQVDDFDPMVSRVFVDAILVFVIKFVRYMFDEDYTPPKVQIVANEVEGTKDKYVECFGRYITFSADKNALYFYSKELDLPLPASNPELSKSNELKVVQYLAKMRDDDLSSKVFGVLLATLPFGNVNKEDIASKFAMSLKAFHNNLERSGTSYQKLLDDARQQLAQIYLEEGKSVTDVAYLLGYSDSSNFTRAYKRWTGKPPSNSR